MEWIKLWTDQNHYFFDLHYALLNYGPRTDELFGTGLKQAVIFTKGNHAEFYLTKNELERQREKGYHLLMDSQRRSFLVTRLQQAIVLMRQKISSLITLDLSSLSNEELTDANGFGKALNDLFICYLMTQPHKTGKLEEELKRLISEIDSDHVNEIFAELCEAEYGFEIPEEKKELFDSFLKLGEIKDINLRLARIPIQKVKRTLHKKYSSIIDLHKHKALQEISSVLSDLTELRYEARLVWMEAMYYNELLTHNIVRRFSLPVEDFHTYDLEEVGSLLKEGKKVSPSILAERRKGFLKILNSGEITTFEGEEALEQLDLFKQSKQKTKELRGSLASKGQGKVRGKAVVLSYKKAHEHTEKISNMEQGQILISEMTRPNILVACEKAGAIVTDEGGILCHASIVSRELGIPCIVGTQRATEMIQDGDLVEVDTEENIVRLLQRFSEN